MPGISVFSIKANSVMGGVTGFDLVNTIDSTYHETLISPIDNFISNGTEINKLLTAAPTQITGNLIILGYVSAIESYFRAVIRKLICVDERARASCEKIQVLYGAVISHEDDMLPEALFEDVSFAGRKNILESLKNYLGIGIQDTSLPNDLKATLDQFQEICELRHCIVHRFGKFGSRNAISLGLKKYRDYIEKPIKCDFGTLNQLITICHNTVRITNNFLFEKILNRMIIENSKKLIDIPWTWDYATDREMFFRYYYIFYSKLNPPAPRLTPKKVYDKYHKHYLSI